MLTAGVQDSGSAGAGHVGASLRLRNISSQTCTIYGYAGLQLLGQNGQPLPTNLQRQAGTTPKLMRVAPGASIEAALSFSSAVNSDDEPPAPNCAPTPAKVLVTPPDETASLTATWNLGRSANTAQC